MVITVRERHFIDRFKCKDYYSQVKVKKLAFKQNDLFYFLIDNFNYLALSYDAKEKCYCR